MLLKQDCPYTAQELQKLSENRYFDQVTFVTHDLWRSVKNLNALYGLKDWAITTRTEETHPGRKVLREGEMATAPYSELWAVTHMGDIEFCIVQPERGDTVFQRYLERYGEGLCCVRENIPRSGWDAALEHYRKLEVPVLQREAQGGGETVWLDTLEEIGGMLQLYCGPEPRVKHNDRKLSQINVVTDDVDRTVAQLTQLLRIGPWSIGTLDNRSVTNPGLLVDGEVTAPEFHFQLGISFPGNLEFEVIQPVKGPTVYRDYLQRHGCGFHHIKEVVPADRWDETMEGYRGAGIRLSIQGQVGPTHFAYLACEELFGFVVELGDGLAADPLPDGYNEYTYPSEPPA